MSCYRHYITHRHILQACFCNERMAKIMGRYTLTKHLLANLC